MKNRWFLQPFLFLDQKILNTVDSIFKWNPIFLNAGKIFNSDFISFEMLVSINDYTDFFK